jgi:hypothetical protein
MNNKAFYAVVDNIIIYYNSSITSTHKISIIIALIKAIIDFWFFTAILVISITLISLEIPGAQLLRFALIFLKKNINTPVYLIDV